MKTYTCDICGKEFGYKINIQPKINPEDFFMPSGSGGKEYSDICGECYEIISEAQQKAIDKIKNSEKRVEG